MYKFYFWYLMVMWRVFIIIDNIWLIELTPLVSIFLAKMFSRFATAFRIEIIPCEFYWENIFIFTYIYLKVQRDGTKVRTNQSRTCYAEVERKSIINNNTKQERVWCQTNSINWNRRRYELIWIVLPSKSVSDWSNITSFKV